MPNDDAMLERRIRIEIALDQGHGSSVLACAAVGDLVQNALLYFDSERYRLHAWAVMPNHVHVLATPLEDWTLSAIVHAWKSYSARKANTLLGRAGQFWAPEYYDRAIRDDVHYAAALNYIEMNPVKAGFCHEPWEWRLSSASAKAS